MAPFYLSLAGALQADGHFCETYCGNKDFGSNIYQSVSLPFRYLTAGHASHQWVTSLDTPVNTPYFIISTFIKSYYIIVGFCIMYWIDWIDTCIYRHSVQSMITTKVWVVEHYPKNMMGMRIQQLQLNLLAVTSTKQPI